MSSESHPSGSAPLRRFSHPVENDDVGGKQLPTHLESLKGGLLDFNNFVGLRAAMEALEDEAKEQELYSLFAFTYVPGFFGKLGFEEVDRGELPLKAWKDCLRCPKFQACDEIAVLKRLKPDPIPAPMVKLTQITDFPQFPSVRKQ